MDAGAKLTAACCALLASVAIAACGGTMSPHTTTTQPPPPKAQPAVVGFWHRAGRAQRFRSAEVPVEIWVAENGAAIDLSDRGNPQPLPDIQTDRAIFASYPRVLELPRDATAIVAQVRAWAAKPSDEENELPATAKALDQRTFRLLAEIPERWPLPPDLTRAIGDALLSMGGAVDASAIDPDGRPAIHLHRIVDAILAPDDPQPGVPEPGNIHVADALARDLWLAPETLALLATRQTVAQQAPRPRRSAVERRVRPDRASRGAAGGAAADPDLVRPDVHERRRRRAVALPGTGRAARLR
jgi:hypothetical protein